MHVPKILCLLSLVMFLALCGQGAPQEPVEIVPPDLRGAIQPQVAVSPKGIVYVAYGKGTSIYCSVSADDILIFKTPREIASLPKLALGLRRGPRITASDRTVVISAISHAEGNVYAWISMDGGNTWAAPVRINEVEMSAREGLHAMAGGGNGNVHITWLDLRNKQTELWGATSNNGGQRWGANLLIYKSPDGHICECCSPAIAAGPGGKVWAMWRNWLDGARDTYIAASVDGGKTFGAGKKLGTGTWPLKGCPMDGGHLVVTPAGEPLTAWRREMSIYAASKSGPEKLLSAQGMQPVVAYAKGTPYYLWQEGSKLMLQQGTERAKVLADPGAFPAIASTSPNMPPVVVWESITNGVKTIMAQQLE